MSSDFCVAAISVVAAGLCLQCTDSRQSREKAEQQVVLNALGNLGKEKTYVRKAEEEILALTPMVTRRGDGLLYYEVPAGTTIAAAKDELFRVLVNTGKFVPVCTEDDVESLPKTADGLLGAAGLQAYSPSSSGSPGLSSAVARLGVKQAYGFTPAPAEKAAPIYVAVGEWRQLGSSGGGGIGRFDSLVYVTIRPGR
jgi:hypothetical protein